MKNIKARDCLDRFGDQGGYFDVFVRPMLQQGHEGELCGWLKEISLIRTISNCPHSDCKGRSLVWCPARIIDKYSWNCSECGRKQSIREKSFFFGIKCDLKICLQLILGWCQMIPSEVAASFLNVKKHVVKKVHERCDEVSRIYVMQHPEGWLLGGQNAILIVDEFPGGCMAQNYIDLNTTRKRNNNSHTIMCIVEANTLPPRVWLHMIEATPEHNNMIKEAITEITRHIIPGSYIVANNKARCCNYESLLELKQYKIISVEHLQKFDPPEQNKLLRNLETIWRTSVEICEEVQETTHALGQRIISRHLWRQKFGSSSAAFENMLDHIAECFQFT